MEAVGALAHADPEAAEVLRDAAAADAEFEAPLAEHVHHGRVLGAAQRIVQGQQHDGRPHPDALRARGHRRRQHQR